MDEYTDDGIPRMIYGTAWKEDKTEELVRTALEEGFRGIDTANQRKHYHEAGVGEALSTALEDNPVERDDLFVQTKFTYPAGQDHRLPYDEDASPADQVRQSLDSSLDHLGTDYVDSLVLHGPSSRSGLTETDWTVWETFEELLETDQVRRIGVSNVTPAQLEELISTANQPPAIVQNRCFARTGWGRENRALCEEHGIHYQGFSLLTANQRELQSSEIREIAQEHGMTIPQVIFTFALQVGMLPLTGTTSREHMREDLACFDFELSDEEIDTVETVAR